MLSRRLQDRYSRRLQDISPRRLQRDNVSSSKTPSRRLGRRKIVTLKTCWRRFKTCLEDVFKMSSRPTNVCWETTPTLFKISNFKNTWTLMWMLLLQLTSINVFYSMWQLETLFFIKVYWYAGVSLTAMFLPSLKTSDLKEIRILFFISTIKVQR